MSLSRVVTEIWWEPGQGFDPRADLIFSDATKIQLDPADCALKLRPAANGAFPLDTDLAVRTRTYRPEALRRLLAVQVHADLPADTYVRLRVWDGAAARFWDGAAWDVAGSGEWSTEDEVNQHLAALAVDGAVGFGLVLNLVSEDAERTPVVSGVSVLWEGRVDWTRDVLLDSLTGTFRRDLVFPVEVALPQLPAATRTLELRQYHDEGRLEIAGIEAVYNHTTDPRHRTELSFTYASATGVVTLVAELPAGTVPLLRVLARANVVWDTGQEFAEVRRLPEVVLRDVEAPLTRQAPFSAASSVTRKDTGAAVRTPAPVRASYRVAVEVRTDRSGEQMSLCDRFLALLTAGPADEVGPFLRSRATDRRYRLRLTEGFQTAPVEPGLSDVRLFRLEFLLEDVCLYLRPAEDRHAVRRFNPTYVALATAGAT